MQDEQVGDPFVLGKGQAQRRFGLAARLSMAVHAIDMTVNTLRMAVHSVRDVVSFRNNFALDLL